MRRNGRWRTALVLVVLSGLALSATGCGYLKNVRDDLMDCGTLAVGIVPPVVPTETGTKAVGFLPPAIGVYAQATDLFHLGAIYKATGDLEWDRRGVGLTVDQRAKIGLGPAHWVWIEQDPIAVNAYKRRGNQMDGWRQHMNELRDPILGSPAKTMIFEPTLDETTGWESLRYLPLGWQDWEFFSLEVAVPEPFILHSGLYLRAGFDPSQVFDLVLGLFTIDLYDDAAYTLGGALQH